MKIWPDIIEKDPYREIISVVKVNDHRPKIVLEELEEYVPTDEVKKYFRKFVEEFIESRRGSSENVCVWISGFFGSGKSHFLKILGYLLENRKIPTRDGLEIESTKYLAEKLDLKNLVPLLTKELTTKVIFINLLDYDHAVDPTITRLVYRKLMEEKGFSDRIWVSIWEEELEKRGVYHDFKKWVEREFNTKWEDARKLHAERILRKALVAFLNSFYPNEDDADEAIKESKKLEIKPSSLVKKLKEFAEEINKNSGRIVVLLDEVGLYIGDDKNRLADLNALAEQVVREGEGKVWLIVTAQEALPDIVERLTAERDILEYLKDRFRLHLPLTPSGVEKVVSERMLKKRIDAIGKLREFYGKNTGKILEAITLKQAKQIYEVNEEKFIEFYPFYPYSIGLLQEISRALVRTIEDARRFSARERSMLKIVHAILRGEGGIEAIAEKQLGIFVTFDIFYDAISQDLRFIKSDYHNIIEDEIGKLGEINDVRVSSVAKALFLLQNIEERVPTTLENLSAILFKDIESDFNSHKETVKACLDKLKEHGWVIEEAGKYKLLTYEEHDIERRIRENMPRIGKKHREVKDLVKDELV
ncbi:BREX system P-loop protein BrxC [Archaeoglobales archaeon]|nr:MAG: BREX system P-loop protein BrxC [Archaeoglobales archaeon]